MDGIQADMFGVVDGADDLIIIGTPRDAKVTQTHSTFRKIEMGAKQSKLLSLEWGDIMVMLPRELYQRVVAYIDTSAQVSKADALIALLESGLTCFE